jgi:hypothetical protein
VTVTKVWFLIESLVVGARDTTRHNKAAGNETNKFSETEICHQVEVYIRLRSSSPTIATFIIQLELESTYLRDFGLHDDFKLMSEWGMLLQLICTSAVN